MYAGQSYMYVFEKDCIILHIWIIDWFLIGYQFYQKDSIVIATNTPVAKRIFSILYDLSSIIHLFRLTYVYVYIILLDMNWYSNKFKWNIGYESLQIRLLAK